MTVFGGTGDLTHRKLMPAVYNLKCRGELPENFAFVGVARKDKSDEQYRNELKDSVRKYSELTWRENDWQELASRIFYLNFQLDDDAGYQRLKNTLQYCDVQHGTRGNRLYYLAVAPEHFSAISGKLSLHGMAETDTAWRRIVIEKPFGFDLASAEKLNTEITHVFQEKNIYRIDHYLGKEMMQNMMVVRFANTFYEPLWSNQYIDHVQITAGESGGVGDRGRFYDGAGAIRDMVQNHMMQMLSVTAMEPPYSMDADVIHDEKVKILRSLRLWPDSTATDSIVLGQFEGYRQEKDVNPQSQTETFAAVKLEVNTPRWRGIPFYLRTGKMLKEKLTQIVIQFKRPNAIYPPAHHGKLYSEKNTWPNLIKLKVQPEEGVVLQFNAKKPASLDEIVPVSMDFCQNCDTEISSPEAYERLLADIFIGDTTRFTRWDELETAWRLTDSFYQVKRDSKPLDIYNPGSWGPHRATDMLLRSGRQWWDF